MILDNIEIQKFIYIILYNSYMILIYYLTKNYKNRIFIYLDYRFSFRDCFFSLQKK